MFYGSSQEGILYRAGVCAAQKELEKWQKTGTNWAEEIKYDPSFCTGVQFYEMKGTNESEVADAEIQGMCMQYGHTEGSCCGGCLTSVKEIFGEGWYDVLTTIIEAFLSKINSFFNASCEHLFQQK